MPGVGVLATFRVEYREDFYPRIFLREFEYDGVLWPFAVLVFCQSMNDERYTA
jgi:hypothetical protein